MVPEAENPLSGLIGIPIADPGTPNHQTQKVYEPSEEYYRAKLKINSGARAIFDILTNPEHPSSGDTHDHSITFISSSDLESQPPQVRQLCNQLDTLVRDSIRSNKLEVKYSVSNHDDKIFYIPKNVLADVIRFAGTIDNICKGYFQLSDSSQYAFFNEKRYHELLEMDDVDLFAQEFNKVSGEDLQILRFIAIEKIIRFKSHAYFEDASRSPPKIDSKALPRAREKLMQMFKKCRDYDVKKKALLELNDLLESDPFDANGAYELNVILDELNDFFSKNYKSLQAKLVHIMTETYAKVLKSILLYSIRDPIMAQISTTIVVDEEGKKQTKENVSTLAKMNRSHDSEAIYWSDYADHCITQLETLKTRKEQWLDILGSLAISVIRTGEAISNPIGELGSVLNTNYHEIKETLKTNVEIVPSWFPSILMLEKLSAKTLNDPEEFDKIIPHFQKLKEIDIPDIHYGIIVNLEQIAIKTPHKKVEQEALKLLLHYIPMRDEKIAYRVVKALGRLLKNRNKKYLSNTCYIIMEMIDAAQLIYGKNNQSKLRKKIKKFTSNPEFYNTADLPFYPSRVKYFLNQLSDEGYFCDLGGQSFITSLAPSSHPLMLPLLNRMNRIKALKSTEPDVYGNTPYHHAAKSEQPHMIRAIKDSDLAININARNFDQGDTALHEGVRTQCLKTVNELLECGANPSIKNKEGLTPLHLAVIKKNIHIVTALLQKDGNARAINKAGQSPLTIAIEEDLPFIVRQIILNSSNPNELKKTETNSFSSVALFAQQLSKIRKDASPIILAARKRKYESLKILLCFFTEFPSDVAMEVIKMMYMTYRDNQLDKSFAEFHADNLKDNPVYASNFVHYNDLPQPRYVNGVISFVGTWPETPELVQHARHQNTSKLQEQISKTNISEVINDVDEFGSTALSYVMLNKEYVKYITPLIESGADIAHYNHPGLTPLHFAAISDNTEGTNKLIENGAVVDIKTGHRLLTPLHLAAFYLNSETVDTLLSKMADPNEQTRYGDTALHMACFSLLNHSSGQADKDPRIPDIEFAHDFVPDLPKAHSTSFRNGDAIKQNILSLLRKHENEELVSVPENDDDKLLVYHQYLQIRYRLLASFRQDHYLERLWKPLFDLDLLRDDVQTIRKKEQHLRLAFVILRLLQTPNIDPSKQDFFGNNVLHLAVTYGDSFMIQTLCHLCPELFWQRNHEGALPIETALSSKEPQQNVESLLQSILDTCTLEELSDNFLSKTDQKLPLNNILAAANLHNRLKDLMVKNHAKCVERDLSHHRQTSLHVAARYGHEKIIEIYSDLEKDKQLKLMNVRDYFENTAGHIAILNDQIDFALKFIEDGGNLHAKNRDGRTMLHLAASKGQIRLVTDLIKKGANPFEKDIHGNTSLHLACLYGWVDVVNHIIKENKKAPLLSIRNDEGRTPLHCACQQSFNETHTTPDDGKGVFFHDNSSATIRSSKNIVSSLMTAGALTRLRDINGMTPLMIAAANGYIETVNVLLGNDGHHERAVDIRDEDFEKKTALHHATTAEHILVVKALLEHDRQKKHLNSEIDHHDAHSFTPFLLLAKKVKHADILNTFRKELAELYLSSGVNYLQRDVNGRNFLHWACINGHEQLTNLILEHVKGYKKIPQRISIHAPDRNGNTPLHHACEQGHLAIVKDLVAHGVSIDTNNDKKPTPLLVCVKSGQLECAEFLIDNGADVSEKDNRGRNILHILFERDEFNEEEQEFLKKILKLCPKLIKEKDNSNEANRPIHIAAKKGHKDAFHIMSTHYPFDDYSYFKWKRNHHDNDAGDIAEANNRYEFKTYWLNFDQSLVSKEVEKVKRCYHLFNRSNHNSQTPRPHKPRRYIPLCCRPKAIIPGLPVPS